MQSSHVTKPNTIFKPTKHSCFAKAILTWSAGKYINVTYTRFICIQQHLANTSEKSLPNAEIYLKMQNAYLQRHNRHICIPREHTFCASAESSLQ